MRDGARGTSARSGAGPTRRTDGPEGNGRSAAPRVGPLAPHGAPPDAANPETPPSRPKGLSWSPSGGLWACIALWSAVWATTLAEAGPDEALPLRWLRAAAEHPVRTALAGLLAAWAGRRGCP